MLWQLWGATPEAVEVWGDITTFFKARMKSDSLQKMVFFWMEKIFRESMTVEQFFCSFMYAIYCRVVLQREDVLMLVGVRRDQMDGYWKHLVNRWCRLVLQREDVLMLVGVRRDQMDGYWKHLVNRWWKMHHQRRRDPHHKRGVGLQCYNLHRLL